MVHEAVEIERKLIDDGLRKNPELLDRYAGLFSDYHSKSYQIFIKMSLTLWILGCIITIIVYETNTQDIMYPSLAFLYGVLFSYILKSYLLVSDREKKYKARIERLKGTQEDEIQ